MGVWIETAEVVMKRLNKATSRPTWACGLKLLGVGEYVIHGVTPHVGVWIETCTGIYVPKEF